MGEQEKQDLWTVGSGWEVECYRLRDRLDAVEASEARMAEVLKIGLSLTVYSHNSPQKMLDFDSKARAALAARSKGVPPING